MKKFIFTLLALVIAFSTVSANATQINYVFSVEAISYPSDLVGTTSNGTFSFDSSIVPSGGGSVTGRNLTDLSFIWNGITYDENSANTGTLEFNASGNLIDVSFGTNCIGGTCSVSGGTNQWFFHGSYRFYYAVPGYSDNIFMGTPSFSFSSVSAVPEPTTILLLGLGLIGLAGIRRKIR